MRKQILLSTLNHFAINQHEIILVDANEIMAEIMLDSLAIDILDRPAYLVKDKQSWHKQNRGRLSKKARR